MEEMARAGKAGRRGSACTHQGAVPGAGVHWLKPGCLAGAVPKTPILVVVSKHSPKRSCCRTLAVHFLLGQHGGVDRKARFNPFL